jgi:hypothetical protein
MSTDRGEPFTPRGSCAVQLTRIERDDGAPTTAALAAGHLEWRCR